MAKIKIKIITGLIVFSLALINSVNAASFDCKKAGNFAERSVCADESLSKLDEQLAAIYKKIKTNGNQWRKGQLKWLKQRNVCGDVTCLKASYETRISYLKNELGKLKQIPAKQQTTSILPTTPSVNAQRAKVKITRGKAYQLCQDYAALMSRVELNPLSSCKIRYSFDEQAYKAGFNDFNWREVTKEEIKEKLLDYWLLRRRVSPEAFQSDKTQQDKFNKFYNSHQKIWVTTVDINHDGKQQQLYRLAISGQCSGHRFAYFVHPMHNRDLSFLAGDLFLYQGRPYLQQGSALLELRGGKNIIHDTMVCDFER